LWAGAITLGLSGTQGNAETTTLTAGLNAVRPTRADKTTVYFNAIKASALIEGIEASTAEAMRGGWAYDRNAGSRLFLNSFNDYEFDRFQNLDLRFVLGGGLGYVVWRGERGRLDVMGGGAYNHEAFASNGDSPAFSRNSGEAYAGDELTYRLNSVTSLFQKARIFPNLSDRGEYRLNFDGGATTQLTQWLTWTISVSNRLLSNPIVGREKNDLLYTTGIGVNFTR
jgi:putative salt-induced outer membrane protein YdiY